MSVDCWLPMKMNMSRAKFPLPLLLLLSFGLLLQLQPSAAKVFERCELAQLLQRQFGMPREQAAVLVCIAQHASDLNTAHFGGGSGPGGGSHGLFQISDVYWCSPPGQGAGCGVSCARLRDDDIADDVLCVRKIYAEHQRIAGDGFTAWQAYEQFCRHDAASYIAGCGGASSSVGHALAAIAPTYAKPHSQVSYPQHNSVYQNAAPQRQGKIYSRCELAQELYYHHKMPMQQIPTWVCIAQHESSFNTAAVGRLNADGSADHGLFQISDLFWCTHDQRGGKGCHASCDKFLDTNIADDVQCIKRIHQEHTGISGDGFTAWTVYNRDCRNQRYEQVAACFNKPPVAPAAQHPNAISGATAGKISYAYPFAQPQKTYYTPATNNYYKASTSSSVSRQSYQGNPFLRQPQTHTHHPNAIAQPQKAHYSTAAQANPFYKYKQQTQQQHYYHQQQPHYQAHTPARSGKVYTRCELAQELFYLHKFPMQDIATWVCIAEHESRYDTAAVGRLNTDGSADHGLFQISDLYWCTHSEQGGKGCQLPCEKLLDDDITDDVQCIRTIHEEHTRLSGDGFTAWTVYNGHCRDRTESQIASCFDGNELASVVTEVKPLTSNEVTHVSSAPKPKQPAKIYSRCELAQELHHKHKLPMQQIPTWVCIAQHESSFNTAAEGHLNSDGSVDHGLFQISDLYWCSHELGGGKGCHISCDKLLDQDISDDVQCIRNIYEEHTRISGDGFTAWTVYNGHCRDQSLAQLSDCFKGNEIEQASNDLNGEKPQLALASFYGAQTQVALPKTQSPQIVKIPANHPYGANPFLQHLSASTSFSKTTAAPTTRPTIRTTDAPYTVQSNHPFAGNPFLQHLKPNEPADSIKFERPVSTVAPKPQLAAQPSYASNPFLNGDLKKISSNALSSSLAPFSNSIEEVHSYAQNPFLSKMSQTNNKTTKQPQYTSSTKSKATQQPPKKYVNSNSFREDSVAVPTTTRRAVTTFAAKTTTRTTSSPAVISTTKAPTTRAATVVRPYAAVGPTTQQAWSTTTRPYTTSKLTTTRLPTLARTPATTRSTSTTTTHPTFRYTTRPTTTTRQTTRFTTTAPSRQTTRPTATTKPTTRFATPAPTTRSTNISTTRQTTRPTATARPVTRFTTTTTAKRPTPTRQITSFTTTTRPTTRSTTLVTTRQTTRTPTTYRPLYAPWTSTTPRTTTRYITKTNNTTTSKPLNVRTTRLTTTTRPTTTTRTTTTTQRNAQTTRSYVISFPPFKTTTRPTTTTRPITTTRRTSTTQRNAQTTRTYAINFPTFKTTTRPTTTTRRTTNTTQRNTPTTRNYAINFPPFTSTTIRPTTTNLTTTRRTTSTQRTTPTTRPYTSTTPKPYLFSLSNTTTTRRPSTTKTTTKYSTTKDPFDHPFFAKFKAKFEQSRTTTTAKPANTGNPTLAAQNLTLSPYYQKFQQNNAKVAAKTVFAYDFGLNRTTTTTTKQPAVKTVSTTTTTTKATAKTRSALDLYLNWNKQN